MSDEARMASEAARRRHQLRDEQRRHDRTRAALQGANALLLRAYLRQRLRDASDFEVHVGVGAVLDGEGRIVWDLVDARLAELLASRPYLELPPNVSAGHRPTSALDWLMTG